MFKNTFSRRFLRLCSFGCVISCSWTDWMTEMGRLWSIRCHLVDQPTLPPAQCPLMSLETQQRLASLAAECNRFQTEHQQSTSMIDRKTYNSFEQWQPEVKNFISDVWRKLANRPAEKRHDARWCRACGDKTYLNGTRLSY